MKRARRAFPWVLLAALCAAYLFKPDGAAALTIFPAWTWVPFGLVPALFRLKRDRKGALLLWAAWIAYGIGFGEEWRSLSRGSYVVAKAPRMVRVVSLNCAGGEPAAAREVAAFRPDIVLLQESPGPQDVERLAKEIFGPEGAMVKGPDASILARGPVQPFILPRGTADFVAANVRVEGEDVTVVSLRLLPPVFRIDLISPSAWKDLAANRQARREEIAGIASYLGALRRQPTILGGDFNCQSGDRALDAMPGWLHDTFYEAGRGWGHTAVNDYPLARIDQVWVSNDWRARQQFVQKTVHSDHRMVVCDLQRLAD